MTNHNEDIWSRLTRDAPAGAALTARIAFPEVSDEVLAAIDSSGNRHFLIPILDTDEKIVDNESRGLNINSKDLRTKGEIEGEKISKYIDIMCIDKAGFDGFNLIGYQMTEAVSVGTTTKAEAVRRVLARWRYFWGRIPKNILSKGQIIGLFAELWFLRYWLLPHYERKEVLRGWSGPRGGRHDFELPSHSIEVKGTVLVEGRIHWIHGLDQLLPPENGRLLFFSLKMREEANGLNNLPELVRSCSEFLNDNADDLDQFENALVSSGYSPVHDLEYEKIKFRIVDEILFRVNESFPKITSETLINGCPRGVEQLEYQINLDGFEECILARNPEDFYLRD
ncbi:MAG: PD-(D/E)XK motif protein [Thermoplasmataceae archaeon]|jgi:hypothetical protein